MNTLFDPRGNPTLLVDQMIGAAYPTVRFVAENMEYIKHVSHYMPQLYELIENIDNINELLNNIDNILILTSNIDEVVSLSGLTTEISFLYANRVALLALNANTDDLFDARDQILAFANDFGDIAAAIAATAADVVTTNNNVTTIQNIINDFDDTLDEANQAVTDVNTAKDEVENQLDYFRGTWLGQQASDPTADLNGNPLNGGEVYTNSVSGKLRTYNTLSGWSDAGAVGSNITPFRIVGNNTSGPYTLPETPLTKGHLILYVGGIPQDGIDYTLVGNQLTVGNPVATTNRLSGVIINPLASGQPGDETVGASQINTTAVPAIRTKLGITDDYERLLDVMGRIPQGRLTLTSGMPIQIANVVNGTFIYYTPFVGDQVSLWNGTAFRSFTFTELALSLAAAHHLANKNFDLYVVKDGAGTLFLATGPAWAGDNDRGTGVASAETEIIKGIRVNKNSITVRPANTSSGTTMVIPARQGTVVGWVRTTAVAGETEYSIAPTPVAGGNNNKLFLGNAYNKRTVVGRCIDTTGSWIWGSATARAMNAGAGPGNKISFIMGDAGDAIDVRLASMVLIDVAGGFPVFGIALDSATVFSSDQVGGRTSGTSVPANISAVAELAVSPGLGLHYVQAIEANLTAINSRFLGGDQFRFTVKLAL